MNKHSETWKALNELGKDKPAYLPTYTYEGDFIDATHEQIYHSAASDNTQIAFKGRHGKVVKGSLLRQDAMKLYEMAYFAKGDILELGSYHGLSASLIALAIQNSGDQKTLLTVDINAEMCRSTKDNLHAQRLDRDVTVTEANAVDFAQRLAKEDKRFAFSFVDHDHSYLAVKEVCEQLHWLIPTDGFALFHDFNDRRNRLADDANYGVYQGVCEGLNQEMFEFYGIYGCTGLFRRRS